MSNPWKVVIAAVLAAAFATNADLATAQRAQEIVSAADRVRNPAEPFRSTLILTEYVSGQERSPASGRPRRANPDRSLQA